MIEYPIQAIKDNVIYTKNGEAWAYYRLKENTVGLNSQEAEDILYNKIKGLAWKVSAFGEVDYKILPVPMDIDRRVDEATSEYEGQYASAGLNYANRAKAILRDEVKGAVDYKFFIGIKLKQRDIEDNNLLENVKYSLRDLGKTIKKLSGIGSSVDEDVTKLFQSSEEEAFGTVISYLSASRCTESEMRYMTRFQFTRGQHSQEEAKSLYSLTEGLFDPSEAGYIRIEQLDQESYCAFLPVSQFPIDLLYSEWAFSFQAYNFPIEMNIRTIYHGREKDYKETNKLKKRFRGQDEQLIEANEDDDTLINAGRQLLYELENDIKNTNKPLIRTHVNFVVYGRSKAECRQNARTLKKDFASQSLEVVQPLADQLLLFYQSIPSAPIKADDWEQPLTPESFAESLFSLTRKVGNTTGFYLGKDISLGHETVRSSKNLVFYHPFLARLGIQGSKYSSPHVTISGPTGMGKSYLLKDIIFHSVFYGSKVLITDPKNEMEKLLRAAEKQDSDFSRMVKTFNFITFSADKKDAGKLDPLIFLEGEEAYDTAVAVLEYLAELQSTERNVKTAILKAVRTVVQEDSNPGLLKVVQLLQKEKDPAVKNVGDLLYEIGTNGIAKLLFSDGTVKGIDLTEQVNILQIQNLSLPGEGEKPATRDEHIAVTLMIPLAKFATKFARDDTQTKTTVFEEAWMLTNTGQGTKLIKEMLRTGRSLKSAVCIVTTSIIDYNKADIKENIGTKFAFKAKTAEEAGHIVEYLGLEDNKANRELLKNLTEGQCVMEDIYGRTAKIQTDVLFDEWVKAFNTKEDTKGSAKLEEAFV